MKLGYYYYIFRGNEWHLGGSTVLAYLNNFLAMMAISMVSFTQRLDAFNTFVSYLYHI